VWRTETKLQKHREIAGHVLPDEPSSREFQYLLDGQQRTTALLKSMYGDRDHNQDGHDPHLFVDLTVDVSEEVEDESWRERFLFWDEIDDRGGELLRNTGRRKRYDVGLIVKLRDVTQSVSDLERRLIEAGHEDYDDPARGELRRLKSIFDSYKLSFIELRGIEVTEVCQIFERINQAGQPLSMFDIVVAKTFRPDDNGVSGFYLRGLLDNYREELDREGSKYASLDNTMLLRILAVLVRENVPNTGVHNITDRYLNALRTEHIKEVWEDGKKAIREVFDFLQNHLRLPGPALVPYSYFYMTLASYFFRNTTPDYDLLRRYFWYVSFHREDLLSNTTQLKDHIFRFRRAKGGEDFGFDRFLIDKDDLRRTTYGSRSRRSRAMLALFANQDPRDWAIPERSVLTDVYYMLTNHPNLHHIFPLDFCENHLGENHRRYANSLLNIAYLTQITNLRISNKNPLEYMQNYVGPRFSDIQKTHFLPDLLVEWVRATEMSEDALDRFVDARLEIVLVQLRDNLTDTPFEIIDTRSVTASDGD
jgi:hypothetical protein